MSQDSDSNAAPDHSDFQVFTNKIKALLKQYNITDFDIRCTLPDGCNYLNGSDIDDDSETFQGELSDSVQIVTSEQQKLPFVQQLFEIFKETDLTSFFVDIWLPIAGEMCSRLNVCGNKEFDYEPYLRQDHESALAGVSSSIVHHDAP